uniref:Uncharacterized protein n=1 Tax=Panagrellus redivivus TaxID=6233 RepID=A0A7E4VAH3_PANRE
MRKKQNPKTTTAMPEPSPSSRKYSVSKQAFGMRRCPRAKDENVDDTKPTFVPSKQDDSAEGWQRLIGCRTEQSNQNEKGMEIAICQASIARKHTVKKGEQRSWKNRKCQRHDFEKKKRVLRTGASPVPTAARMPRIMATPAVNMRRMKPEFERAFEEDEDEEKEDEQEDGTPGPKLSSTETTSEAVLYRSDDNGIDLKRNGSNANTEDNKSES